MTPAQKLAHLEAAVAALCTLLIAANICTLEELNAKIREAQK